MDGSFCACMCATDTVNDDTSACNIDSKDAIDCNVYDYAGNFGADIICNFDNNTIVDMDTAARDTTVGDNETSNISPTIQAKWDYLRDEYEDAASKPNQLLHQVIDHMINLWDPFEHRYYHC